MKVNIGAVIIGRNEGERLRKCLESISAQFKYFIYVDSGSTDESVCLAKSFGAEVALLDMSLPFSAGRARNEGFYSLTDEYPDLEYVQFIDGDCELLNGWIDKACGFLRENPGYVIASGKRIEKYPERSIYNQMCDIEWNTPVGDAEACGGDFLVRVEAYRGVKGFNPSVIAGEEPDLCYRLRAQNGKICRLDSNMTSHDADMVYFGQWWKRAVRAGHAFAQGYDLHKADRKGYYARDVFRILLWGIMFPVLVVFSALILSPWLLMIFPVIQVMRIIKIYINNKYRNLPKRILLAYSVFISISFLPNLMGLGTYYNRKIKKNDFVIIEHKRN